MHTCLKIQSNCAFNIDGFLNDDSPPLLLLHLNRIALSGKSICHTCCPFGRDSQSSVPLGLRFLRRFRLARTVEGDCLANERLEGGPVNFFSFVDVDRAACVAVETRVEETGRILQRRAAPTTCCPAKIRC